tara:strand:+ start:10281 stop:12101 length:1821 start_codon:yes stop_codon:yes gene_type:complete
MLAATLRGATKATFGLPGDIEKLARMGINFAGGEVNPDSVLSSTEDMDKHLWDLKLLAPGTWKDGKHPYESIGEFAPINAVGPAIKGVKAVSKATSNALRIPVATEAEQASRRGMLKVLGAAPVAGVVGTSAVSDLLRGESKVARQLDYSYIKQPAKLVDEWKRYGLPEHSIDLAPPQLLEKLKSGKKSGYTGDELDFMQDHLEVDKIPVELAGLMIPIIAGRNKVPKIAADLEKRALSAEQMTRQGADEDAIWRSLQVSEIPRTDSSVRTAATGKFGHEVSTPHGEDLISPYASMDERDKIDMLMAYAPKGGGSNIDDLLARWALEPNGPNAPKPSTPYRRWHLDPGNDEILRSRSRQEMDVRRPEIVAALRDMQSNTVPLPVRSTVGSEMNLGPDFAQQYPELASMKFEAYQDLGKDPGNYGGYQPATQTSGGAVRLHPASIYGSADEGMDPTSVAIHELGHGVQQLFDAPRGWSTQAAVPAAQRAQMREVAKMLRTSGNPVEQRIGLSIANNVDETPLMQYRNIHGEADARNMALRELLTPAQRASQSPRRTSPVAPDRLIDRETLNALEHATNPGSKWGQQGTDVQARALMEALRRQGVVAP